MKNKKNGEFFQPLNFNQILNSLGLFFCVCFLINPFTLFFFNISDWNYNIWLPIIVSSVGFCLFFCFSIIFWILNRFSKKLTTILSIIFIFLAIIILLNDVFFPLHLDKLGLKSLFSEEPFFITLGELILSLIIILLCLFFLKKNKINFFSFIKLIYLLCFILIFVSIFSFLNNLYYHSSNVESIDKNSSLPNIYLIHMDGYQYDYFLKYLNITKSKIFSMALLYLKII